MYGSDVLDEIGPEGSAMWAVWADMGSLASVRKEVALAPLTQVSAPELLPTHLTHQESLFRGHTHRCQRSLERRH